MSSFVLSRRNLFQVAALGGLAVGAGSAFSTPASAQALPQSGIFENLARLQVKPQAMAHFLIALRANAMDARSAPGNIGFNIFQKIGSPNTLFVFEQWQNAAAYAVHIKQPALLAMHAAAKTDLSGAIGHEFLQPGSTGTGAFWAVPDNAQTTANVLVEILVKPGMRDTLLERVTPLLPTFRQAKGNISFDLYKSVNNPNGLVQIERWLDKPAHLANLKRPVITKIRAAYADTLARPLAKSRADLLDVTLA
ncbi:antibiotic biosynthesis monooxygenase [Acidisoma cellulosilytica]|uniref:Antibiotic biosynthesis monooxygenase n=1 Tax=Acidisoma cellulosilyticum TaxID=2802395 RepID=A0A963YWY6_9PROT|nr:putative quinol monooxygenase [Acidisoma cellulosilyticum]MCB8878644.1 antibiotic biosynthesis monooxygenase [Acidisoma cellulosilyticum]